jgi:formylmethanofuran dehydrogenase subunit C
MTLTKINPILKAEDLFDSLQPEEKEPKQRKIEIKKSERLEQIVKGFEEALKIDINKLPNFYQTYICPYNVISDFIQITPTSKEITEFSILLNDYPDKITEYHSGLYLSALINKSDEQEILINIRHLEIPPHFIGFKNNGKIIKIIGDLGDSLGKNMIAGKIYAEKAEDYVGYSMQGGTIHVITAGNQIGYHMQGGTIHVKNAGNCVGDCMIGGTIHIEDKYKHLSYPTIYRGSIFYRNKLLLNRKFQNENK